MRNKSLYYEAFLVSDFNYIPELLVASYSKPGYPYDNAVTEVFFKYLKQREINRRTYHSIDEVRLSCFEYIEQFYNNYNPHSANNGLTPNQKEENYFKKI